MRRSTKPSKSTPSLPILKKRTYPYTTSIKDRELLQRQGALIKKKEQSAQNSTTLPIDLRNGVVHLANTITIESRRNEGDSFDSYALYSETKLREVLSASSTTRMKRPNIPLTSVCTDLLLKLANVMPAYTSLINLLGTEIVRAIYFDFDDKYFALENQDTLQSYTPYFEIIDHQREELARCQTKLRAFAGAGISMSALSVKRQNLMNKAIGTWQAMILRRMFENWRMALCQRKRQLYYVRNRRCRLWFDTWRRKMTIFKLQEAKKENEEYKSEIAGLEDYVLELRDHKLRLTKENQALILELSDSQNVKLRQSNVELDLKEELEQTRKKMEMYKTICEGRMKEDMSYITNRCKHTQRHLLHAMYPIHQARGEKKETKEIKGQNEEYKTDMQEWLNAVEMKMENEKENEIVRRWANHHLHNAGINHIENFSTHLRDGEEWSAILTQVSRNSNDGSVEEMEETKATEETKEKQQDTPVNEEVIATEMNGQDNSATTAVVRLTHQDKVMSELDISKRSTMNVHKCNHQLKTPDSILEPEEVLQCNPDANFTMMAYLFLLHPRLQSKGEAQLFIQKNMMQFVDRSREARQKKEDNNDIIEEEEFYIARRSRQMHRFRNKMMAIEEIEDKSHALYVKAQQRVARYLIGELSGRIRGDSGAMSLTEEKTEMSAYTQLSAKKIQDLLDDVITKDATPPNVTVAGAGVGAGVETGAIGGTEGTGGTGGTGGTTTSTTAILNPQLEYEVRQLSNYLGNNFRDLKKIFRAYAAAGSGAASSISRGEFATLLKDIQIFDKGFTAPDADLIFLRSNWEMDAESGELSASVDRSLTSIEFVEALVRCAHSRFLTTQTTTLKGCVEALFNRHLLPYAQRSDVEAFRKKIGEARVQSVFSKYEFKLKMVFIEKAGNDGKIDLNEFTKFLKEKGVVNKQFPAKSVVKIFK